MLTFILSGMLLGPIQVGSMPARPDQWKPPPRPPLIDEDAYGTVCRYVNPADPKTRLLARGILASYLPSRPLSLCVEPLRDVTKPGESLLRATQHAAGAWNRILGETTFVLLPWKEKPDVVVNLVPGFEGSKHTCGRIDIEREVIRKGPNVDYRITGSILVAKKSAGVVLNENDFANVMLHELGHALGLRDHDLPTGIMRPLKLGGKPVMPSEQEISHLRQFRALVRASMIRVSED